MRTGLTVSVVGHLAIIGWGLVSLNSYEPLDAGAIESLPVEFIDFSEVSSIPLGLRTAEAAETSSPNDPTESAADQPVPTPEPPAPKPTPSTPPPPPADPALSQPPEPDPEPPPPPPPPAADPQPAEPEPLPAAAPEAEPQEPPPPAEAAPPVQQALVAPPSPRLRPPRPPPPAPPAESREFTDDIAALLDKTRPTAAPAPSETPATIGSVTGSPFSALRQNEIDALRARLASCWDLPPTRVDPAELRVKVKMFLGADGGLSRSPEVVEYRPTQAGQVAADSALRAVRRCEPYTLPAEKYESWKEIIVTFDPREMFGG